MVTTRSGIEVTITSNTLATELLDTEKVHCGEKAYELHQSRKSIDATILPRTTVTEDANPTSVRQRISYKDSLLGDNYGLFTKAIETMTSALDENYIEIDEPMHGQVTCMDCELCVNLDAEERRRIRERWGHSLIVKVYGRLVGYRFLAYKLGQLWSRIGKPSIVDLGHDFYLIKFQSGEDYNYVIKEGPWFIAGQFLTLRKCEPNFRASEAFFTSVAIWVRLPELPVEYFDLEILKKIGQSIGVLLRVDGHTLAGERGKYVRICVQAESSKSLQAAISSEVPTDMPRRILAEDAGPCAWGAAVMCESVQKSKPCDTFTVGADFAQKLKEGKVDNYQGGKDIAALSTKNTADDAFVFGVTKLKSNLVATKEFVAAHFVEKVPNNCAPSNPTVSCLTNKTSKVNNTACMIFPVLLVHENVLATSYSTFPVTTPLGSGTLTLGTDSHFIYVLNTKNDLSKSKSIKERWRIITNRLHGVMQFWPPLIIRGMRRNNQRRLICHPTQLRLASPQLITPPLLDSHSAS
ncbi:hypothetical protein REPUB_Repub06bG0170600 [Reevesia pubescens]